VTSPRWARWLLRLVAGPDAPWLLADLDEEFESLAAERGVRLARRWYRKQVLGSVPPLLRRRFHRPSPHPRVPMAIGLDFRFALRRARRTPLTTLAVILTIAIGIGATSAVYSVVRGVLLKALPFPDPDRLVRLITEVPAQPVDLPSDSWMDLQDWRRQSRSYEALGGIWEGGTTRTLTLDDRVERVIIAAVTEGMDRVLDIRLLAGRSLAPNEYLADGPRAILISAGFWRSQFGNDPAAIGATLVVADTPRTVVGVLDDAGSEFPVPDAAVWVPVAPRPGSWMAGSRARWMAIYGRLRDGVTAEQARAELQTLLDRGQPAQAGAQRRAARIVPLVSYLTGPVRPVLLLLTAAVIVALIVACANIAILVMAQAESRVRELAVRSALGGSRQRLNRLLAVETLLTTGTGGILGLLIPRPLVDVFLKFYPGRLVRGQEIAIDSPVLAAATLATLCACLAISWPTSRRARRLNLSGDLKQGVASAGAGRGSVRQSLVVLQVALSVALVTGAWLLVRSFAAVAGVDPGFDHEHVVYATLGASPNRHPGDRIPAVYREMAGRMATVPGVQQAATVNYLPLPNTVAGWGSNAARPDRPGQEYLVQYRHITGSYLETLGLPLRRGRALGEGDRSSTQRVALVNEQFVNDVFPEEDPLGRQFQLQGQTFEVVGVVGDMRYWGLNRPVSAEVYVPLSQAFSVEAPQFFASQALVVRSTLDPVDLSARIRETVRGIDPWMSIGTIEPLAARVDRALAPERFRAMLVGGLGLLALLLSGLGIYAVMAYTVARRTREIGIRVALGAPVAAVRRRVMAEALRLAGLGAFLGLPLAWIGSRVVRGFLVGVSHDDPAALILVAGMFFALAALAASGPARRASRIEPLEAIRAE
jgi:predicted permease